MKTNVIRILDKNAINYIVKPHSQPVYTSEDAARERGVRLSQIVKTMIIISGQGIHMVALIPGNRKLDFKALRKEAGEKKLNLVNRDDVLRITGFEPGAVSPIGLKRKFKIYLDEAIMAEEFVDISSGRPDAGIELSSSELRNILDGTVVNISK